MTAPVMEVVVFVACLIGHCYVGYLSELLHMQRLYTISATDTALPIMSVSSQEIDQKH